MLVATRGCIGSLGLGCLHCPMERTFWNWNRQGRRRGSEKGMSHISISRSSTSSSSRCQFLLYLPDSRWMLHWVLCRKMRKYTEIYVYITGICMYKAAYIYIYAIYIAYRLPMGTASLSDQAKAHKTCSGSLAPLDPWAPWLLKLVKRSHKVLSLLLCFHLPRFSQRPLTSSYSTTTASLKAPLRMFECFIITFYVPSLCI